MLFINVGKKVIKFVNVIPFLVVFSYFSVTTSFILYIYEKKVFACINELKVLAYFCTFSKTYTV